MLWVNWIPEIVVSLLLMASLVFLSLKRVGSVYSIILCGALPLFSLAFMWIREDALGVSSPFSAFVFDSFSWFGRSAGMLWVFVAGVYLSFLDSVSLKIKFKIATLVLFFIALFDVMFMSKPIMMFLITWMGGAFALNFMVLSESSEKGLRSALARQSSLYIIATSLFGVLFAFFPESKEFALLFGCLVSSVFPLSLLQTRNFLIKAPLSQSWWILWTYFCGGVFWVRFGLPLFSDTPEVPGAIFCITALASSIVAIRTSNVLVWLGAMLSASAGIAWLSLIVGSEQSLNLFYWFGLIFLFVFTFAGYSFHQDASRLKNLKILVSLSMVSFFFPLIEELIIRGYLLFAALAVLVWFLMSASAVQQLGRLITTKNRQDFDTTQNKLLFMIFLSAVIILTTLKAPLLQLLNRHVG